MTARAKVISIAGGLTVGIAAMVASSAREVTVTSVRYLDNGRTAVIRLTNKGDSFVRCSPLQRVSGASDWLWPATAVDLMPHSSFEFGLQMPVTGPSTFSVRCEPTPRPLWARVDRWLRLVRIEIAHGFVMSGNLPDQANQLGRASKG